MKTIARVLAGVCLVLPLHALELPAIFADHMVLQRDMPVPVWGKAEPGARIEILLKLEKVDHEFRTHADGDGYWSVKLPAIPASSFAGNALRVDEWRVGNRQRMPDNRMIYLNVLVGDVWHCSGQSNMGWTVNRSNDAAAEIAAADYPLIRHFTVPRTARDTPQFTSDGSWQVVSPDIIGAFSAVGYYFGRKIHRSQGVPIGLINTAWGAASAEAFTSMPTLLADPSTAAHVEAMAARSPDDDKFRKQHTPAAIYHGMIHPVAPFAHRGVLWYQGEANANHGRAVAYRDLLPRMIEDWRTLWDQPGEHRDTPFLIVQLANFRQPADSPPATDNWAELRDSQAQVAATVPHAHLATAIDIGDAKDIHPTNKQDVGLRLARLAEHHVYGDESVVPVGPTYETHIYFDMEPPPTQTVSFNHALRLTTTDGQAPRGFAIRPVNTDEPWVWAKTYLNKMPSFIELTHPDGLAGPFDIRYAYGINPADGPHGVNLVNGEGLPAMPFRTDAPPTAE